MFERRARAPREHLRCRARAGSALRQDLRRALAARSAATRRAPGIIAEALGRKLGRTVTIDEIGMANGKNLASGVGLQFAPTVLGAVEQVCELWRSDVGRRDFLTGSTVAASALVEPSRDWLITAPDDQVARSSGARVGASDVEAVRAMTEALSELDHRYGSGHIRPVVVHYLNSVVSGLLAGSYREPVGRGLFAAVARLTELAGYMAVDTGQPGLAQRYYIQSLRLAQAAGRPRVRGLCARGEHEPPGRLPGKPARDRAVGPRRAGGRTGSGHPARRGDVPRGRGARARADGRRAVLPGTRPGRAQTAMDGADAGDGRATTRPGSRTSTARTSPTNSRTATAIWARPKARRRAPKRRSRATPRAGPGGARSGCSCWRAPRSSSARSNTPATRARRPPRCWRALRSDRGAEYLDDFRQRLEPYGEEPVVREFSERLELAAVA